MCIIKNLLLSHSYEGKLGLFHRKTEVCLSLLFLHHALFGGSRWAKVVTLLRILSPFGIVL